MANDYISSERKGTGEGVSGLPTRSEVARSRELRKYGLDLSWFDQKVEEQNCGLCADCGKQEKARLGNGRRRPLGLGFDQNGKPNRLLCQSCCSQQRKARMEERNAPKDYASFEEFWAVNREQLQKEDVVTLAALRERDAEVREIYEIVCTFIRYHDGKPCYQLTNTLDEIEQELIENSTTDFDTLAVPFYLVSHRQVFDEIQNAAEIPDAPRHARNAVVFAKYGLLQALPVSAGDMYVREFLRMNGRWPYPDWGKKPNPIRTQRCATYRCPSELSYNANTDPAPAAQWYCGNCRVTQDSRKPIVVRPACVKAEHPTPNVPAWFARITKIAREDG